MKNWIFVFLITLVTNAHAVEVNVKCHGDEIIFATDKKTNALKGAYICSKLVSVPVAIIKDENYDNKLDMQDSISFYISKDFTAYKKILVKKFDNFEQDFNDYLQSSGEKDAYYKIDFENLYDSEEIKTIFKRVQLSSTESKTETLNNLNPNDYDENELSQRKRMYDPQNGRFLTEDPKGFAGGDPNFYRYVENNPQGYVDPSGLKKNIVYKNGSLSLYGDNGELVFQGPGVSGPYGRGSLPKGLYTVGNLRDNRTGSYSCSGSTGYSLNLSPEFSTNRTDLRIHPDGGVPGTLGCIGLDCKNGNADTFGDIMRDIYNQPMTPWIDLEVK